MPIHHTAERHGIANIQSDDNDDVQIQVRLNEARQVDINGAVEEIQSALSLDSELSPHATCEAARTLLDIGATPSGVTLLRSLTQVINKIGLDIVLPDSVDKERTCEEPRVVHKKNVSRTSFACCGSAPRRDEITAQKRRLERPRAVQQSDGASMDALDTQLELVVSSGAVGAPLGKLLGALGNAKLAIVSTPENGPGPSTGQFNVPVMDALERATCHASVPGQASAAVLVAGYDFAGSASKAECEKHAPDCSMTATDWKDSSKIEGTQWCRYWSGRVRATLQALLLTAEPLPSKVRVEVIDDSGKARDFGLSEGTRVVFAVSIAGGPVTQTEKRLLPGLINGTLLDLSTRELNLGKLYVFWLHFDRVEHLFKALQGYGGIDLYRTYDANVNGHAGRWIDVDSARDTRHDLLARAPGATPEEVRAWLIEARTHPLKFLNSLVHIAIEMGSARRLREVLAAGADANIADDDGYPYFCYAVNRADPELVRAMLDYGADKTTKNPAGQTPLDYARIRFEDKELMPHMEEQMQANMSTILALLE